jgi:hypothetical protein
MLQINCQLQMIQAPVHVIHQPLQQLVTGSTAVDVFCWLVVRSPICPCVYAGLGSLLQTAEMAWQQDDDLYSSSGHVLAAALEVHARIVNAGGTCYDSADAALPQQFHQHKRDRMSAPQ